MAAPQSVKRGLRRVRGVGLEKQWDLLLGEGRVVGGGDVRFMGWWMGERSDVGGTARERAVRTIAVSERRNRHGVIIVLG